MHRIVTILFCVTLTSGFSSCIEPFSPNLGNQAAAKYVVYGQITDQEGYQIISVSRTSTLERSQYNSLSNCDVKILDNHGNVFKLVEFEAGNYRAWMGKEYLNPGSSYQVNVLTPNGDEIISDFDQMQECPEIDSVYYIRKDLLTTNPEKPLQGVQFYVDLDGKNTNSRYFRWELTETWEHHASYPKILFWNKKAIIRFSPPDSSLFFCWSTSLLKSIYTLSTDNLAQNRYKMFQLHYVDNQTQRLTYCYSLLVNQFAISEPAYIYWNKLRTNTNDQGGLYEIQPLHFKGNLKNTTNPDQEVLGFFGASAVKSKRIFARNIENMDLCYPQCEPRDPFPREFQNKNFPYLYLYDGNGGIQILENGCVECNYLGGSTVKPDYWPY